MKHHVCSFILLKIMSSPSEPVRGNGEPDLAVFKRSITKVSCCKLCVRHAW